MTEIINKSMEREDLLTEDAKKFIGEITELVQLLQSKGQKISSWYGIFDLAEKHWLFEKLNRGFHYAPIPGFPYDADFPWFLLWEMYWLYKNNDYKSGESLLDLGGSSSLFSFYLASKGLKVVTVDLQKDLVDNGNKVAAAMGWDLRNYAMDMKHLDFADEFDHITSVCVFEHIPMYDRVQINKGMYNILKPNGTFSITFDFKNPSRAAQISTPIDIEKQFIMPSGLRMRGNKVFADTKKNYLLHPFYHPDTSLKIKIKEVMAGNFPLRSLFGRKVVNDYTFGALFMKKEE